MLSDFLSEKLANIKNEGLLRKLHTINSAPSEIIKMNGKEYINFSSNDYLGLAGNKEIAKAGIDAIDKYGFAGASSRLVGGNLEIHDKLESELASFKSSERALLLPSGFQTNLGVISALAVKDSNTCIIMDKLNHASLWDGAKLSGARIFVYNHCDMDSFESVLKRTRNYKFKLAITESVFSMDGDITPLDEFAQLCQKYGAVSMVDEAHSTGVFGKEGRGLVHQFGVNDKIDIIIGTLSKAFAVQGGFVAGSKKLIDFLINKSRAFIYTTAVSPAICGAVLKSLEIIKKSDEKRQKLSENSIYLRNKLKELNFNTSNSQSQIIPIVIGSIKDTEKSSKKLFNNGIYAPAIKFPTVPKNQARIRVSLTSQHSKEQIKKLISTLID